MPSKKADCELTQQSEDHGHTSARELLVHFHGQGRGAPESREKPTTACHQKRSGRRPLTGAVPPPGTAFPQRGAGGRHRLCHRAAASIAAATSLSTSLPQSTRASRGSAHHQHPLWHAAASPCPHLRALAHGQATAARRKLVAWPKNSTAAVCCNLRVGRAGHKPFDSEGRSVLVLIACERKREKFLLESHTASGMRCAACPHKTLCNQGMRSDNCKVRNSHNQKREN